MSVRVEQFLQNLSKSGLVADDAVSRALDQLPPEQREDPRQLAKSLIRAGRLTKYQARALIRGRVGSLRIRDYEVLDLLGKGGMGRVYKARHRRLDRIVALKVLKRDLTTTPEFVKRFGREMRAVARLSHRNIVQAYDAGQCGGRLFLAMEYIDGTDLRALLTTRGPVKPGQALDLVIQAAKGLAYAHSQGIVHRDVKPANLILDRQGVLKILDFGLARFEQRSQAASSLTQTGVVIGTIDVMSPEQFANTRDADHRSDVYSLGCVLYLLLTAKPVFAGASPMTKLAGHAHGEIPSLRLSLPGVPDSLDQVFQRMVAKSPADRHQSMAEVLDELTQIRLIGRPQTSETVDVPPEPETMPTGDLPPAHAISADTEHQHSQPVQNPDHRSPIAPRRARRGIVLAGLAVLALIVAGAMLWIEHTSGEPGGPSASGSHRDHTTDDPVGRTVVVTAPEAAEWTAETPLHVFVLAGQFNMAGRGFVADLEHLAQERMHRAAFGHLMTDDAAWIERGDVWIFSSIDGNIRSGGLTVGYGEEPDRFGPELGFGQVVGDALRDPVLIVKVAEESLALALEGRPPSSGGDIGAFYASLVRQVRSAMDDVASLFPMHAGRRPVITGFVWFQGWNDSLNAAWIDEYEANLANLIRDLRGEWGDNGLPVVIGEFGPHGKIAGEPANHTLAQAAELRAAQRAVAESAEFHDTVRYVETSLFVRRGPGAASQYGENAETFYLVGEAFGEAMLELIENRPAP